MKEKEDEERRKRRGRVKADLEENPLERESS